MESASLQCAAVAFGCLALTAAQREKTIKVDQIEAQRIIVRDAGGQELITLGMIDQKFPGLRLQLPGSRASASFFTGADHATLALMDHQGASSITLNSGTAKSPPDLSIVRVVPGPKVQRLFRAP